MMTIPSERFHVADTGQTGTQGGLSHCMQGLGVKRLVTFGKVPISSSITGLYTTPGGRLFSATQAIVHAEHPTHFRRSSTITHLRCSMGFCRARRRSCCIRRISLVMGGKSVDLGGGRII